MKPRRLLVSITATAALALSALTPAAAASTPSCVGWFASTFAQEDPRGFAATISAEAHQARPFGWTTVAPFAHTALEDCQGDDD